MNDKYIIGGGLSGLIFAFYNKDYRIISPDIGGKLKTDYLNSTILLHDTPETRSLLHDLNLSVKPKVHIIKYLYQGNLLDNLPTQLRKQMVTKKLTKWKELNKVKPIIEIKDNTLSTNDIYIPILKLSTDTLIKKLTNEAQIIIDKVVRITDKEIITENERFSYVELISTVAAPIFWKLYGQEQNLKSIPVTFVLSDSDPLSKINTNSNTHWDLIYCLDKNIPFTRINKYKNNQYLYEFSGDFKKEQFRDICPGINVIKSSTDPYGIVITDHNNIPPPKVRFLGRFATWDHTYKIQDVITESISKYDFISIWNKQKDFNSNFFDFNVQDIELQQKLTKEFILHIEDEAHELLSEINWKMGKYKIKAVNRNKLLEEWIDIFKYWMGIGNIWGFTIIDFVNEFWRKSSIVDIRFKNHIKNRKLEKTLNFN